jgi:hypothetical protein
MGAFMIALAADETPAIIERREHKPASARVSSVQHRVWVALRYLARAMARSRCKVTRLVLGPLSRQPAFLALKSSRKSTCWRTSAPREFA